MQHKLVLNKIGKRIITTIQNDQYQCMFVLTYQNVIWLNHRVLGTEGMMSGRWDRSLSDIVYSRSR